MKTFLLIVFISIVGFLFLSELKYVDFLTMNINRDNIYKIAIGFTYIFISYIFLLIFLTKFMDKKLFLLIILFLLQSIITFLPIQIVELYEKLYIFYLILSFCIFILIIYIIFEWNKEIEYNKNVYFIAFILYIIFIIYEVKYQIELIFLIYVYILSYYLINKLNYIKDIKITNSELKILSSIDYLTQVYNRKSIDYFLRENEGIFKRYGDDFSIILIDIDNFKEINDTYGHLVGDTVLVKIADILKIYTRDIDIVGRFGGEEFIIICRKTKLEGVIKLAENLRKILLQYHFEFVEVVTASFGVTSYKNIDTINEFLQRADSALYLAKSKGKNRVEYLV